MVRVGSGLSAADTLKGNFSARTGAFPLLPYCSLLCLFKLSPSYQIQLQSPLGIEGAIPAWPSG